MSRRLLTRFEESAADEGIAGHIFRAATDGGDATQVAVGVHSANAVAWIHAFLIQTGGFACRAFRVRGALRSAQDVRIS